MDDLVALAALASQASADGGDGGGGDAVDVGASISFIGRCELYATLAEHNATVVRRVMRLHYVLARLTIDEWLRPLPPPSLSVMHDPARVTALLAQLLAHRSLQAFAALPQLYLEAGFGPGNVRANVTRALFPFGGPRHGLPNTIGETLALHEADFVHWWCDGAGRSCAGFEEHYNSAREPSLWRTLVPAYIISNTEWVPAHDSIRPSGLPAPSHRAGPRHRPLAGVSAVPPAARAGAGGL